MTVDLYGVAVSLWLDGAGNRVHLRRFDFASVDAFVARHRDTSVEIIKGRYPSG